MAGRVVRGIALTLPACLMLASASHATGSSPSVPAKWRPWVELGGYYGTDSSSRGEAALWAPLMQGSTALMFADIRGKLFEEDFQEGNFALGLRQMTASGWNLGVWGGYDIRSTDSGNTFRQISGGMEALSANWDLRANAYAPRNDRELVSQSQSVVTTAVAPQVQLIGNQIAIVGGTTAITTMRVEELALWGFDGEVGYRLLGSDAARPGARHELRVYAGGFWFDHKDLPGEIAGPKARAEWRIDDIVPALPGSRLTVEGEFSHDDVRKDRWEVGARLRLPFGGGPEARQAAHALSAQERRMAEALERDTDIVTSAQATSSTTTQSLTEGVEDALTDVPFDRVAFVDTGDSVTTVSTTAGANTLIVVRGDPAPGEQTLQGDQTLLGSGTTIEVRGTTTGTVLAFTDPGATPTLHSAGNGLTLAGDNIHVAGVDIRAANYGIRADSKTNTVVNQVGIDGSNDGIEIGGTATGMRIIDTTIANIGDDGIEISGTNHQVRLTGTTIDTVDYGIFGPDGGNTLILTDTTLSNIDNDGIYLPSADNTLILTGTTISNSGNNAIYVPGDNNTLILTGTTISGTVHEAIFITFGSNNTMTMSDSTLAGNIGGDGLRIPGLASLNGTGNIAAGATIANDLCQDGGTAWTGSIEFDSVTITEATCP